MIELSDSQERRAKRLHEQAIIVDTHCDTLMQLLPQLWGMPEARKLGNRSDRGHIDLPRMIEGGVTCQTFAIYTGRRAFVPEAPLVAMQMVDKFYSEIEEKHEIVPVTNHSEII
jgi:membrane dipeptidase